ncbi:MAG TPA: hypothetical protein VFJ97_09010 [Dermatophilaceae bacterium]|nr:hypothetical protein [Dermatophilaceae bacterium]
MRTTVNIDTELLRRAKQIAVESGRSLGEVIDDALRVLTSERVQGSRPAVDLPVFGGSGLQPGIDLENKEALAALLGDDGPARAAG